VFGKILRNFALCILVIPIAFVMAITGEPFRLVNVQSHNSPTVRQQVGTVQYVVPFQWKRKFSATDGVAFYKCIVFGSSGRVNVRAKLLKAGGVWRLTEYSSGAQ